MKSHILSLSGVLTLLFTTAIAPSPAQTNNLQAAPTATRCIATGICFNDNGVLQGFPNVPSEHYNVCWTKAGRRSAAWDYKLALPYWRAPEFPQAPAGTLVITRTTTDGALKLKQTFTWDNLEKDLTVSMDLTNTSGTLLTDVYLDRLFIDGMSCGINDRTRRSVSHTHTTGPSSTGTMLTAIATLPVNTTVERWDQDATWDADRRCGVSATWNRPVPYACADSTYEMGVLNRVSAILGTMSANQTKNVKFVYRIY
ncbi:MAG: hypothetical protein KIT09_35615 [Bryobacteraceae bacterium]|nr:hypothetical protein [Bryobacteraceae bacterium]